MKNFEDATENEGNPASHLLNQNSFGAGILSQDEEPRHMQEDVRLRQIKSSAYEHPPHGGYDIYMNHPQYNHYD